MKHHDASRGAEHELVSVQVSLISSSRRRLVGLPVAARFSFFGRFWQAAEGEPSAEDCTIHLIDIKAGSFFQFFDFD